MSTRMQCTASIVQPSAGEWVLLMIGVCCRCVCAAGGFVLQVGGCCWWVCFAGGWVLQVGGCCRWVCTAGGFVLQVSAGVLLMIGVCCW